MKQFAIIGAGQLGTRHMQSLAGFEEPAELWVYDPFPASLQTARERWQEAGAPTNIEIRLISDLHQLPAAITVAIVATNANVRRTVVAALLKQTKVQYLILEKVLFQTTADYEEIDALLRASGTRCWVNCPRRMFRFYQELRRHLSGGTPFQMTLQGSQWGLGCNTIHFLDLFYFLSGGKPLTGFTALLDDELIASKRVGFTEFTGQILGGDAAGNSFLVISRNAGSGPSSLSFVTQTQSIFIRESERKAYLLEDGILITRDVDVAFQSQLTLRVVNMLLSQQACDLTPYEESAMLHKHLLPLYLQHYNERTGQPANEVCPIT